MGIWNPTIWNLETFLKVRFQMVGFSNVQALAMTIVPTIWNWDIFVQILNSWTSGFQIPFKIQTICKPTYFDHLKSRLVRISDPHCSLFLQILFKILGLMIQVFGPATCFSMFLVPRTYFYLAFVVFSSAVNESGEIKPRSLRFTWSMKTTSSRDPNEIMAEIKKVSI